MEVWDAFKVYCDNIIKGIFVKTIYYPSVLPTSPLTLRHMLPTYNYILDTRLKTSMGYHTASLDLSRCNTSGRIILWFSSKKMEFNNHLVIFSSGLHHTALWVNETSSTFNKWRNKRYKSWSKIILYLMIVYVPDSTSISVMITMRWSS